jgi:hypothetical protein
MTAPTNRPMNPIEINPPIEPKKITSMGTGAPRPRRIGSKRHTHAEVKHKEILIAASILVRVKRKINPGRPHR